MLLKSGANVSLKNEFEAKTALHAAAKFGKTQIYISKIKIAIQLKLNN